MASILVIVIVHFSISENTASLGKRASGVL
jgi:hypothetical protein